MTKERGITLIALIITIIVMLILVGVTITVAMQGGLFDIGRRAAKSTEVQADRETLQGAVAGAYDVLSGKVDKIKLQNNLSLDWTVTGDGPYTCTSPLNNIFLIDSSGNIIERLVYGKKYKGKLFITLGNPQQELDLEVVFSQKYNRMIIGNDLMCGYTYDEQNRIC